MEFIALEVGGGVMPYDTLGVSTEMLGNAIIGSCRYNHGIQGVVFNGVQHLFDSLRYHFLADKINEHAYVEPARQI